VTTAIDTLGYIPIIGLILSLGGNPPVQEHDYYLIKRVFQHKNFTF
jgi:hypothetical protein